MNAKKSGPSNFVTQIDLKQAKALERDLKEQEFDIQHIPHALFSAKKQGIACTLYESGKLVVQGKGMEEFIEFYLEPCFLKSLEYSTAQLPDSVENRTGAGKEGLSRIGIDESGKGDFFGPLCIAGVYADKEEIPELAALGVQDSKNLSDLQMDKIADKIRRKFCHHVVQINPKKYNQLYDQFRNLNLLLAWGHATAIERLVLETGCHTVLIDQFAHEERVWTALKRKKLDLDLTQRHRGEEDLVVAAASILARNQFVEALSKLGKNYGVNLPKGASNRVLEMGRELVKKFGVDVLGEVGKLHFKTASLILRS